MTFRGLTTIRDAGSAWQLLTTGFFVALTLHASSAWPQTEWLQDSSQDQNSQNFYAPDQSPSRCETPVEAAAGSVAAHCASCPTAGEARELKGAEAAPIEKRVRAIDRALLANDLRSIAPMLGGEDTGNESEIEAGYRSALENVTFLSRESRILKIIRIGDTDATYITVDATLRPRGGKAGELVFERRQRSAQVLFFRWDIAGRKPDALPVLARMECLDEDAAVLVTAAKGRIGCAPCSWNLERPNGWFLVPRVAGEGAAFDSISFIHPNLKISIDFDCYTNPSVECPLMLAERDHGILLKMLGVNADAVKILKKQAQMEGSAIRADFIADYPDCKDPRRFMRIHRCNRMVSPFLFNFVVRGEASEIASHNFEIRPILESLHINRDDFSDSDRIERVSKTHMVGARLSDTAIVDEELGISIEGPEKFVSTTQPGVGRFCIRYHSPANELVSMTIFTWEGEARCFGEREVQRFFESRRDSLPSAEYKNWRILRSEVSDHRNGVDVAFEIESEWTSGLGPAKDRVMRELFVAIPLGRFLCGFVARAPRDEFDTWKETFTKSAASLRHTTKK